MKLFVNCIVYFCLSLGIANAVPNFASTQAMNADISLKEKIGQMLMIGFNGTELHANDAIVHAILAQQIGGVILFDYNFQTKTYQHNIQNPVQLRHLTQQLQSYAKQAAKQHHNNLYPLLIGIDYEGGKVNRLKEKFGFPKTVSAAEIGRISPEKAKTYADQMAATLQQEGINLDFAPVVDININPNNPVIGKLDRSFSNDPQQVVNYAEIFSKAFKNHNILCVYKHFPGHGSSTGDTHEGFVDVTTTWKSEELYPYQQLLNKPYGCPMVMIAHVINHKLDSNGYPAGLSKVITTDLLRKKLNFNGVVISDDMQMKAITNKYTVEKAVNLAVNAGADILVFGNQLTTEPPQDPKKLIDLIYSEIQSGKISQTQIDSAFNHIMQLKQKLL